MHSIHPKEGDWKNEGGQHGGFGWGCRVWGIRGCSRCCVRVRGGGRGSERACVRRWVRPWSAGLLLLLLLRLLWLLRSLVSLHKAAQDPVRDALALHARVRAGV